MERIEPIAMYSPGEIEYHVIGEMVAVLVAGRAKSASVVLGWWEPKQSIFYRANAPTLFDHKQSVQLAADLRRAAAYLEQWERENGN